MRLEGIDRKNNRRRTHIAIALICLLLLVGAGPALADDDEGRDSPRGAMYEVTITNLTYDQVISPPVVAVHDEQFSLFQAGQPAGPELAALAEDGMTGPLAGLLMVSPGVSDYAVAGGGIPPMSSTTVEVRIGGRARRISVAGMLISSNDAFAGLSGYSVPYGQSATTVDVPAYDSGSEANTEACAHIPGPPCGNGGVRVTDGAEGFVYVHRGIQGTGDLDAPTKDWRNPTARITIQRK